jgi:CSLREA domain-containing protein
MKTSSLNNQTLFRVAAVGMVLIMLLAPLAPVFAGGAAAPLALGTIEVTTLSDAASDDCVGGNDCSLRGAILLANASASSDDIVFNHSAIQGEIGNAAPVLALGANGELPLIEYPVQMNLRYTNPVSNATYDLLIDGSGLADDSVNSYDDSGFRLAATATDSMISNVNLETFPDYGVYNMADEVVLDNVNVDTTANGNGIFSRDMQDIQINNLTVTNAASHGILLNNVTLNAFGTNQILNVVVIGNGGSGIYLTNNTEGAFIWNSFIGVLGNGSTPDGNAAYGVTINDSYGNTLTSNVISANVSGGVNITDTSPLDNTVFTTLLSNNKIGVTGTGTATGIGNGGNGVNVNGVPMVQISGGNVISANGGNGVRINGTDASGAVVNGNKIGTDGTGEIDAGNATNGVAIIDANDVTVSNNQISGNASNGISASASGSRPKGLTINNNIIGLDKDRIDTIDNDGHGVLLTDTEAILSGPNITKYTTVSSNIISGNDQNGVRIAGDSSNIQITSNTIGVNTNGVQRSNGINGIHIVGTSHDIVASNNVISKNAEDGVRVADGLSDIYLNQNSISANIAGLGIDLAGNGVTGNDSPEADGTQNFPVISNAVLDSTENELAIDMTLLSLVGVDYAIDLYINNQCDPSNFGEGLTYFHREDVTTGDGASPTPGLWSDTVVITGASGLGVAESKYITAVASRNQGGGDFGSTSEFSNCIVVVDDPSPGATGNFVVNSLDDDGDDNLGDGICETTTNNECTLRAAVEQANVMDTTNGPISITFSLSGAFSAPFVIDIGSTLTIDNWMLINGGSELSNSGTPFVVLNGSDTIGMNVTADGAGSKISHLVFYDFSTAIRLVSTNNVDIEDNYIGPDYDGLDSPDGNLIGVAVNNSANNTISGNVISGNDFDAVQLNGAGSTDNLVSDNIIGPSANGNVSLASSQGGVLIDSASNNTIEDNVIAGNGSYGIGIDGGASSSGNEIIGNQIGVSGVISMGNGLSGIFLDDADDTLIQMNTIRNNSGAEVAVVDGDGNRITNNFIDAGAGMGIDLGNNGVTNNDVGDNDTGPNNYQNYPVLSGATAGNGNTWIEGTFNSKANTNYAIELYANNSHIATLNATTNGSGNYTLGHLHNVELATLTQIKALAIELSSGDTSEFSAIVYVVAGTPPTVTATVTSTPTATPTNTTTPLPTNTGTLSPTNTTAPSNTPVPTSSGGGGFPTNTQIPSSTPNGTTTAISASLTALAATNTPTGTTLSGSATASATLNFFINTNTPTVTPSPTIDLTTEGIGGGVDEELVDIPDDAGGGGEGEEFIQLTSTPTFVNAQGTPLTAAEAALTLTAQVEGGLLSDVPLGLLLAICGGLGFLILIIGGGLELYRWLNTRRN